MQIAQSEAAKAAKPKYLRVRINVSSGHPCYRHLESKTDDEIRAWTTMALDWVGAMLDATGENGEVASKFAQSMPTQIKAVRGKVALQTVALIAKDGTNPPPGSLTPISENVPGAGGKYLSIAVAGW